MPEFEHRSLHLNEERRVVFTAMSKRNFCYRMFVSRYVLEQGFVPLNPFMLFDYFLLDSVERNRIRAANNVLLKKSDELWVFGPVSDGVLAEIKLAKEQGKPIKYLAFGGSGKMVFVPPEEAEFEEDVIKFRSEIL